MAADDFFPGYARSFSEIGKERGWPPVTRSHFDALLGLHTPREKMAKRSLITCATSPWRQLGESIRPLAPILDQRAG